MRRSPWQVGSYISVEVELRATLSVGCGEANSRHSNVAVQIAHLSPFESMKSIGIRNACLKMVENIAMR